MAGARPPPDRAGQRAILRPDPNRPRPGILSLLRGSPPRNRPPRPARAQYPQAIVRGEGRERVPPGASQPPNPKVRKVAHSSRTQLRPTPSNPSQRRTTILAVARQRPVELRRIDLLDPLSDAAWPVYDAADNLVRPLRKPLTLSECAAIPPPTSEPPDPRLPDPDPPKTRRRMGPHPGVPNSIPPPTWPPVVNVPLPLRRAVGSRLPRPNRTAPARSA